MPKHLPRRHYEHSVIGRRALDALHIGPAQHALGLTRAGFLFAQMESAQTLDISLRAISDLPQRRSKALWRSRFAAVPGFCHVRLFAYDWVVPAICALGAYPDAADVARLCPYFRSDRPASSWGCSPPPPGVVAASSMFKAATGRCCTMSRIGSSPCPGPSSALAPLVPLAPQAPLRSLSILTPTPSAQAVVLPLEVACHVVAAPATSTGPPLLPQVPALARLGAVAEAPW